MEFDIDVSGNDVLSKDYTICISDKNNTIKGYKFSQNILGILTSRFGQGLYKYSKSKKGKTSFKVRLYCIIIYYLFKSLDLKGNISLNICRDFTGKDDDIRKNLKYFLEKVLNLDLGDRIYFVKLRSESNAHHYSYLMRHDNKNLMKTYVNISIEEIERWIKK